MCTRTVPHFPSPLLPLLLLLCALALTAVPVRASIIPQGLDDSFSLRVGDRSACPGKIEIDTKGDPLVVNDNEFQVDEKDCDGGAFTLRLNPSSSTLAGVAYLRAEARAAQIGNVIAGAAADGLKCGTFAVPKGAQLVVFKPSDDVKIRWKDALASDTGIVRAEGDDEFKLKKNTKYLIYGSGDCLYSDTGIIDRTCFPAEAAVERVANQQAQQQRQQQKQQQKQQQQGAALEFEKVAISKLRVGDRVVVGPNRQTSPVIGWTHRDAAAKHSFVRLHTDAAAAITATEGHYIRADGALRPMRDVKVGMQVVVVADASSSSSSSASAGGEKTMARVVRKTHVSGVGLYNPQTAHGDIVVGGVVASTYTEAVPPRVAHALLAPVRAAYCVAGRLGAAVFMSWA